MMTATDLSRRGETGRAGNPQASCGNPGPPPHGRSPADTLQVCTNHSPGSQQAAPAPPSPLTAPDEPNPLQIPTEPDLMSHPASASVHQPLNPDSCDPPGARPDTSEPSLQCRIPDQADRTPEAGSAPSTPGAPVQTPPPAFGRSGSARQRSSPAPLSPPPSNPADTSFCRSLPVGHSIHDLSRQVAPLHPLLSTVSHLPPPQCHHHASYSRRICLLNLCHLPCDYTAACSTLWPPPHGRSCHNSAWSSPPPASVHPRHSELSVSSSCSQRFNPIPTPQPPLHPPFAW